MRINIIFFFTIFFTTSGFSQTGNSLENKDYTIKKNKYYENEEGEKVPLRYGQKYSKNPSVSAKGQEALGDEEYSKDNSSSADNSNSLAIIEDPKVFADRMVKASTGKYVFLQKQAKGADSSYVYRYIPSTATNKGNYSTKKTCKDCMDIEFRKNLYTDQYIFSNVWGNFSDLFSVWKNLFKPSAQKSDYQVNEQSLMAEWNTVSNGKEIAFGRLGEVWYIIMK